VVIDEEGAPVEEAVVYVSDDPSNRALSDPDGEFILAAWSDSDRAGSVPPSRLLDCNLDVNTPGSSPAGWPTSAMSPG
jgi:hypothetical protein